MFESLGDRLSGVFDRLRGRGALTEADVRAAMREVRIALLEADVALRVVREFVDKATEQAVGQQVLRSVTPGQQVVKIVHDALVEMLGSEEAGLHIAVTPPAVVMLVGLQGSGKTTTTAKLARRLTEKDRKKVLMASLDVNRPAAQEQLAVLGRQADVATLPIVTGQPPVDIARRALNAARLQGFDVLMLDTAGRLHVDQALMDEMKAVAQVSAPQEVLLVADALTGQDAVNVAKSFVEQIDLTGVILTRLDGDARGGAALSMRAVTGRPIKFAGVGEGLDKIEPFSPERIAGRILGMGDIVSLVERAQETIKVEEAEALAQKMAKGQFDLNDLRSQLQQMQRMGGIGALAGMLPGIGKLKNQMNASGVLEGNVLGRLDAIISSMTPKERLKPELMNAKRKIRVAKGSGTTVQEVNKLLKMHRQMADVMKMMGGGGKRGLGA
ncbi:MAG: signal recognition particle protein, partial [Pseudomonadota bacterium]|nr:signal recognition particle protein [Pseudomonadota bacterium]